MIARSSSSSYSVLYFSGSIVDYTPVHGFFEQTLRSKNAKDVSLSSFVISIEIRITTSDREHTCVIPSTLARCEIAHETYYIEFRFSGFRPFLDKLGFKDYFLDLNKTRIFCASKCNKLILLHCDEKFRNKKLDSSPAPFAVISHRYSS